jgi:nitrogen-specific signal transduction histidine kinase
MSHSIGELVRREQAARAHAEEASRLKDTFLATLSHELRTPLTAILGWASIISREPLDNARIAHALEVIKRNADRQVRLIDDLLDTSRLVSGQMRFQRAPVRLTTVIEEALDTVRPSAATRHIDLVTWYEASGSVVSGDPDRLQQVVWNLLSNAVRFSPPGGRIEVILREVDGQAEIRVVDNGAGLAPDFIAHAFEPFRQADSSVSRPHGGLGLGLAIARHIVELHGGTVRAESDGEGRGSSFIVRLPIQHEAIEPRTVAPAIIGTAPLGGTRVLVVDDEPDTREVLRAILEEAGAMVTTTASAGETREILPTLRPDLLIADIGMPDEDGYSLMRSVRAFDSDVVRRVPAIALTAHARAEDVDRALASGFQVHLAKPIEAARLVSTISALVPRAA